MDPVKGHMCDGLEKYQFRNAPDVDGWISTCVPIFDTNGNTVGCDDTNYNAILFCPFCGIKLDV